MASTFMQAHIHFYIYFNTLTTKNLKQNNCEGGGTEIAQLDLADEYLKLKKPILRPVRNLPFLFWWEKVTLLLDKTMAWA